MALIESKQFLSKNVSVDPNKWLWRNLHVNDYENLPWSKTSLRPFLHRTVGVPGNLNTPNFSKINERKNKDNVVISSNASATLKMLV